MFFDLTSLLYSIMFLTLVPIMVIISDRILELLRPKEVHHRLNVPQMILYISLLILGIVIIYKGINIYITDKNIKEATMILISPLVTISSQHLSQSIAQYIPDSLIKKIPKHLPISFQT